MKLECRQCGLTLGPDDAFCSRCGTPAPQATACPSCGAGYETGDAFCGECGAALAVPAPAAGTGAAAPPRESAPPTRAAAAAAPPEPVRPPSPPAAASAPPPPSTGARPGRRAPAPLLAMAALTAGVILVDWLLHLSAVGFVWRMFGDAGAPSQLLFAFVTVSGLLAPASTLVGALGLWHDKASGWGWAVLGLSWSIAAGLIASALTPETAWVVSPALWGVLLLALLLLPALPFSRAGGWTLAPVVLVIGTALAVRFSGGVVDLLQAYESDGGPGPFWIAILLLEALSLIWLLAIRPRFRPA